MRRASPAIVAAVGVALAYQLNFSRVNTPGQYQVKVLSPAEDNVVSWPSVEPADDYTAASLLAFALGADQGSGLG